MVDVKFTSEEWISYEGEDYEEGKVVITTQKRLGQGKVPIVQIEVDWNEPFESEQRANANLLRASKDLYESLETLLVAVENDSVVRTRDMEAAHLALASVRGE